MKFRGEIISCLSVATIVCFNYALSEYKTCSELRRHRKWVELAGASKTCGVSRTSVHPRVMGGSASALAEFPWMVRLTYSSNCNGLNLICGGFLITKRHVLTAGHCCNVSWLGNLTSPCDISGVVLGDYDKATKVDCYEGKCLPSSFQEGVDWVKVHENFSTDNSFGVRHDICLLRLSEEVETSTFVNPICLPDECNWKEPSYKWDELKAAGWGLEQQEPKPHYPGVLQTLKMMTTPFPICAPLWKTNYGVELSTSNQLCAGMELGKNVCKGDSGGPLMHQAPNRMVAVGILSLSQKCALEGTFQVPAVFIRTAYFLPWVLDNL